MQIAELKGIALNSEEALQRQLYRYISGRVSEGIWREGLRLPASRKIASELGISRNTVTAALGQLCAEGYLSSRPGSGIYVGAGFDRAHPDAVHWDKSCELPELSAYGLSLAREAQAGGDKQLPFTLGVPDLKAFPLRAWNRLQRQQQNRRRLLGYDGYQGFEPLREALAGYLRVSRQVRCSASQIIITQGAQQAISLCAQVLLDRGEEVLVENPGYSGARRALQALDAKLTAVNVDAGGLTSSALPAQTNAKLMYVTPSHHYPLGGIMSAPERLRLLDWAARTGTWLIEDDYDSEFHFHGHPIAALQGMSSQSPVLYMGSFSKTLFPALRIGYLVLPTPLVAPFLNAKQHMDGESPLLQQATVAQFIEEGHFQRHLRQMRVLYREKWLHLSALIESRLAGLAQPVAESAGMHLVLRIPGVDDVELTREFVAAGFGGTPLSSYYIGGEKPRGIALGFANSDAAQRAAGIECLRSLIKDQQRR
ncbi:PLP-dependent aminotransferase family protein [Halioglobus maricola]|uniref:PLP-dependent aminotransferase family protein n=1 Tax=Halioglobus maricola TaxID=2601894 RepID=A0A5P9NJ87_9GAMM|nr:PLP-dependent aminotransferase family protein [Halioglobus maricola]QFU75891.1 PLP-dependent aminotransferase family protein [Halioglobus maricola]